MKKQMYYRLDNGDTDQIVDSLEACVEIIKGEWPDAVEKLSPEVDEEEAPFWTISPVFMTEEEFEKLPEAY